MAVQAGAIALASDVAPLANPTNVVVGIVSMAAPSGGGIASATIVFPTPLTGTSFACWVAANSGVPGTVTVNNATPGNSGGVGEVTYSSISATGVTINMYRAGTTSTSISYRVEGF